MITHYLGNPKLTACLVLDVLRCVTTVGRIWRPGLLRQSIRVRVVDEGTLNTPSFSLISYPRFLMGPDFLCVAFLQCGGILEDLYTIAMLYFCQQVVIYRRL